MKFTSKEKFQITSMVNSGLTVQQAEHRVELDRFYAFIASDAHTK